MILRENVDKFIDQLDAMIPVEIQQAMQADMVKMDKDTFSWLEFANLQERARVLTIKDRISSTHKWILAKTVDSRGYRKDEFLCETCDIKCSVFEHINKLSIISKVTDGKPTYTVHNAYLMFTCDQVIQLRKNAQNQCFNCGISEYGATIDCHMVGS